MNNINPIKMELPQELVSLCIEANNLQKSRGGEEKLAQVQRLQYEIAELICGIVDKEVQHYLKIGHTKK